MDEIFQRHSKKMDKSLKKGKEEEIRITFIFRLGEKKEVEEEVLQNRNQNSSSVYSWSYFGGRIARDGDHVAGGNYGDMISNTTGGEESEVSWSNGAARVEGVNHMTSYLVRSTQGDILDLFFSGKYDGEYKGNFTNINVEKSSEPDGGGLGGGVFERVDFGRKI